MTIIRRIRGVIGCALLGAIPWSFVGVAMMLALRLGLIPGVYGYAPSSMSHAVFVAAALGATYGAINGVVFGVLVVVSERKRSVENIRSRRIVALGAVANASVFSVIYGNAWGVVGAGAFCVAAIGAATLGAASSASMLWVARRATRSVLSNGTDETRLPRGAT